MERIHSSAAPVRVGMVTVVPLVLVIRQPRGAGAAVARARVQPAVPAVAVAREDTQGKSLLLRREHTTIVSVLRAQRARRELGELRAGQGAPGF